MGLIKAGIGALGGVLADQWKEFFYCDALDMDTLVVKGQKLYAILADLAVLQLLIAEHTYLFAADLTILLFKYIE